MIVDLCTLRLSGPEIARRELCYRLEQQQIPVFAMPSGTCIFAAHTGTFTAIVGEINDDLRMASPRGRRQAGEGLQVALRPRRGILPGTGRPLPPPPALHGGPARG